MSTILEGIEDSSVKFAKADFLVTSETLNKIAGAVYNQERSWKLRAYLEDCDGKKMIVLCDDDLEEEAPPSLFVHFFVKCQVFNFSGPPSFIWNVSIRRISPRTCVNGDKQRPLIRIYTVASLCSLTLLMSLKLSAWLYSAKWI